MLILTLALRDLLRDRVFAICNTAVIAGILVPLLVLFGVKNGVYSALTGEMLADPANLQIDTAGNVTLRPDDIAPLRDWPEIAFMTPKVRAQFDYVNVRAQGGRRMRSALVLPTGAGDPTLPRGVALAPGEVAVSAQLAAQLDLAVGGEVQMITQAEDRPRQLLIAARIGAVLPERAAAGRAILAAFETLDLIEAFYDSYALPEYGIEASKSLADRAETYAGLRVYARRLEDLGALQARVESVLGLGTVANTREVAALLSLGRNLNLALTGTSVLAALGLGAALGFGFWAEVARKRPTLAGIALIGVPAGHLALFPVVQALATALAGLVLSFVLFALAGQGAAALFADGLPAGAPLVVLSLGQAFGICLAVLVLAVAASGAAAWAALQLDPASVLREAG